MKLETEAVKHVAALARLGLTDAEIEKMRDELAPILDYFEMLGEIDTEQIPPTAQVIAVQNNMRPDKARPSANADEVLVNAPAREGGYFKVKAVFGEE
jgi:aspartyl-tRNA(Asn)/glutamyl-tRNA(Gln) amidotransferase subunit C